MNAPVKEDSPYISFKKECQLNLESACSTDSSRDKLPKRGPLVVLLQIFGAEATELHIKD